MLQFRRFHEHSQAGRAFSEAEPSVENGALAAFVDSAIRDLRDLRRERADAAGFLWRSLEGIDRTLRTETLERLDRDEVSDRRKLGIVEALHGLNVLLFSYWRFLRAAAPLIRRINQREGRPARIVELAAGYGEFTLRAPAMARRMGLDIEVTGTDIVPAYVERARSEAVRRGVRAHFEVLDAFRMDVAPSRFDIALIAQSMHHFTAGQLATMIAACRRVLTTGVVGVDGSTGPPVLTRGVIIWRFGDAGGERY